MSTKVVLFPTCIVDALGPRVGSAVVEVLRRRGCDISVPDASTCCGQPAWNAGHARHAAKVARTTLNALSESEGTIVVAAGSCATMVRIYWGELFAMHGTAGERGRAADVAARTQEFSEFVYDLSMPSLGTIDDTPTVYHRSCHMLRELGIRCQPEELLDFVASDRREPPTQDLCCGFGGLFSVKLPELSVAMADEILDAYIACGAKRVVGCDLSCLMQLEGRSSRRSLKLEFSHLSEIMNAAETESIK